MKRPAHLAWQEVEWARPFAFDKVCDFMARLNGFSRRQAFIWEIHLSKDKVRFLLGTDPLDSRFIKDMMTAHHSVRFETIKTRPKVTTAYDILLSKNHFALQTKQTDNLVRTILSHAGTLNQQEKVVIQLLVGKSSSPRPLPKDLINPNTSFWQKVTGNIPKLSADAKALIKEKLQHSQFQLSIRLGLQT